MSTQKILFLFNTHKYLCLFSDGMIISFFEKVPMLAMHLLDAFDILYFKNIKMTIAYFLNFPIMVVFKTGLFSG